MVDGINLAEVKEFARAFKLRRLSLGLTQTQVRGQGVPWDWHSWDWRSSEARRVPWDWHSWDWCSEAAGGQERVTTGT